MLFRSVGALVVLVIGLVAGVVVFVEPVDFTAGDAGRIVVAVFVATGVLPATALEPAAVIDDAGAFVTLVIGATGRDMEEPCDGAKIEETA